MEKDFLKKLSYENSLTIKERIKIYSKLDINNYNYSELQNWMKIRGVVSENDIYKMIELNDISVEDFNRGLKKLDDSDRRKIWKEFSNFDWFKDYKKIMENYLNAENNLTEINLDLSLSLSPFILWYSDILKKEINKLKNIIVSKEASIKLMEKLVMVLLNLSMKTLVWELHLYENTNKHKFENNECTKDDEKFKMFIRETFMNKDKLIGFYRKYPVIARRITVKSNQIINHYKEMLFRIDKDFDEIKSTLGLDLTNEITDFNCDQGDTHEEGRFVIKINFGENIIIYKPRDLRIEQKFNEFVEYVSKNSNMLELYINKALYRENYTFENYVKYEPCKDEEQVIRYYKRFGQICALIYILTGNDIHYENIISYSEYPVIIDIETLFQHQTDVLNLGENAFVKAYKECIHSVGGTALLPIITFAKDKNSKGIDISALNGGEQILPHKMLSLKDVNKDTMRFDYDEVRIDAANNIPILNGKKVSFVEYMNYIINGFKECLNFIMNNKNNIIGENGILNIFKGISVRHLLKSTQSYAKIMAFSSHPNYSEDMIYLERMFSNIWNYNYKDKRAIKYEYEDMLFGDIPIFFGKTDSTNLISSKGEVIDNYFKESAFNKTKRKIEELNEDNIRKQVAQIEVSLGLYKSINNKKFKNSVRSNSLKKELDIFSYKNDRMKLLKEAEIIGDRILRDAIYDKDSNTITWNNIMYDDINECYKVRSLDKGLGYGMSGVLLFYYYLKKCTNSNKYDQLIATLINSCFTLNIVNKKSEPFEGDIGLIYTLSIIYKDNKSDQIKMKMHSIAREIDKNINILDENNIRRGYSGIINIMLNAYKIINDPLFLEIIKKYVKLILDNLVNKKVDEIDLINVLYILKKSNEILKDKTIEKECLKLKQEIDIKKLKKFNYKQVINDLILLDDENEFIEQDLITNLFDYNNCNNDTLLEGTMSDLNILQKCLKRKNMLETKELINKYISKVLIDKDINGDYLYYGLDGYPGVGLFFGLAGIGYELLQLYSDNEIPDVLNLEL